MAGIHLGFINGLGMKVPFANGIIDHASVPVVKILLAAGRDAPGTRGEAKR